MRQTARLAALALALGLASPAAATRQVALVMKDPGAPQQAITQDQLKALADQLWAHGIEVVDVSKGKDAAEVSRAMPGFMGKLAGADVAVLYYVGVARTGVDQRTVVFARQAQGEAPPTVQDLLERMKESKRSVAVLDILKRRSDARPNEQPGLGGIKPAGNQLVAFANTFDDRVPAAGGLPLTASFLRHLGAVEQQAMPLVKLASLVKEDVALETGGLYVPWVLGSLDNALRLERMDDGEVKRRQLAALDELLDARKCTGDNAERRLQSGLTEYRKAKPAAPAAPQQLAAADIYDMLWILRITPGTCFGGYTGPLPPPRSGPIARPTPPRSQPREQPPRVAAVPQQTTPRPQRVEQAPRIEQPRAERAVPRTRAVESAPAQRSAPAVSRGGGGGGFGGGGGGGGSGGGRSFAPPPI